MEHLVINLHHIHCRCDTAFCNIVTILPLKQSVSVNIFMQRPSLLNLASCLHWIYKETIHHIHLQFSAAAHFRTTIFQLFANVLHYGLHCAYRQL